MGQVAFDTLQASEELQTAGLTSQQAKAISLVVRRSHEVADVATKADIAEVNRNIADVRKDMDLRFEKTEAQIADVRKDLSAEIADVRKDMTTQISLARKDLQLEMSGIHAEQKLIRWMLDAGCWMLDAGCWMLGAGCWVLGAGILGILSLVVKAFLMPVL